MYVLNNWNTEFLKTIIASLDAISIYILSLSNIKKQTIKNYKDLITTNSRVEKRYVHRPKVWQSQNFMVESYPIPYKFKGEVNDQIKKLL